MPKIGQEWAQLDYGGRRLAVSMYGYSVASGDTEVTVRTVTDAKSVGSGLQTLPTLMLFNGSKWDRQRNNIEQTILASAARTLETDSADLINYNGKAQLLIVSITAETATPTITLTIQVKDPVSGAYVTIWTAAAGLDAVGVYTYLFQPGGAAGSYTEAVNLRIPRTWRVKVTVADADSMTYSIAGIDLV